MMRLNSQVGPVRTQTTNTQKMNISEMNTQKIPNSHVFSLDESESKIVHEIVNTSEVKYAMNETKYEEPLVTDNSVINAPRYF